MRTVLVAVAAAVILPCHLHAVNVSGHVQTTGGSPVSGVNIDLINRTTGVNIPLSGDTTDISGNFTLSGVPTGNYDVTYAPPDSSGLAGGQQLNQAITSDVTLPAMSLPAGFVVEMQTVDFYGAPVNNINADFYDPGNTKIFTVHDTSHATGLLTTVVPQGGTLYRLELRDVGGRGYAVKTFEDVQVLANTNYGSIVVGPARSVTGRAVRYSDSTPLSNVDVDFVDQSGLSLKLSGDLTNASGNFSLNGVVDGYYDIYVRPTGLDRKVFKSVPINANLALGDIRLGTFHTVSGFVKNTAATGIPAIDLDFTDQQHNLQILLNNDNSLSDGSFAIEVTDGTYTIDFRPPSATTYAPKTVFDVLVTGDVNLGTITLSTAVTLTGHVRRPDGSAIANARIEAFEPVSDRKIFIPGGSTDAAGYYEAKFEAGSWDLKYSPPPGDPSLLPRSFEAESITMNTVKNVTLPLASASATDWSLYQ